MTNKAHLRLDSSRAADGLRKAIREAADKCLEDFYAEIQSGMNTAKGKSDLQKMSENEENIFRRKVIGQAHAIIDSYGKGSLMDADNPFLAQYRSSPLWNPERNDLAIVGRPKGYYINIFGRKVWSSGRKAGLNVEAKMKPQAPSKAFQRAEAWWCVNNGRINDILNAKISEWIRSAYQYFDFR